MKITTIALLLAVLVVSSSAFQVSIFYCGFGGDFCGQSTTDDVNPEASFIILAFLNTNTDGSVTIDDANFPTDLVNSWQRKGKKVIISVGGQNGNWANVFASSASIGNFVNSIQKIIKKYKLDGVDLDIQGYNTPPIVVANAIIQLKAAIGKKILLIVSPEDVTVYQGTPVPDENIGGQPFNYFVNIIRRADFAIDYYQPQAYNNWYDGQIGGSLRYLQDVYLNWRNLQGTGQWDTPIPNFTGVNGNKLLMGVLASPAAGVAGYYANPSIIEAFKNWVVSNKHPLKGFMMWDSHWDAKNGYAISNACLS